MTTGIQVATFKSPCGPSPQSFGLALRFPITIYPTYTLVYILYFVQRLSTANTILAIHIVGIDINNKFIEYPIHGECVNRRFEDSLRRLIRIFPRFLFRLYSKVIIIIGLYEPMFCLFSFVSRIRTRRMEGNLSRDDGGIRSVKNSYNITILSTGPSV